jgi:hypothetical protein
LLARCEASKHKLMPELKTEIGPLTAKLEKLIHVLEWVRIEEFEMTCLAISRVSAKSPLFNAGWPQQVCAEGTSTLQPASCKSFTAAKPTLGRNRSMRHVANKPTRGFATVGGALVAMSVMFAT